MTLTPQQQAALDAALSEVTEWIEPGQPRLYAAGNIRPMLINLARVLCPPLDADVVAEIEALIASQEYEYSPEGWASMCGEVDDGASHAGDCTGQSHTCFVCQVAEIRTKAKAFAAIFQPQSAQPGSVERVEALRR